MFIIYPLLPLPQGYKCNEGRDLLLIIFFTYVSFQILDTLQVFGECLSNGGMNFFPSTVIVS